MNPFHLWLDLPEKSTNPNHYQLLGIKSSERNPQAISEAADKTLARLMRVSPKPGQIEVFEKVRQRILKARDTLTHETRRTQYDARLREKLAHKKLRKSAPPADSAAETEHQLPTALRNSAPAGDGSSAPVMATPAENSGADANIPMAIPIPPVTPQPTSEVPLSPGVASLNLPGDHADLSIKTGKIKRRKKSWLVPVFCLVLCLGGIAGLVYLVTNYDAIVGSRITMTPIDEDPVAEPRVKNESRVEDVPDKDAVDPTNTDPRVIPGNLSKVEPSQSKPGDDSSRVNVTTARLNFDQLVQYRRSMENARRALYRRDPAIANNEIQNAQALFVRFVGGDVALEDSQLPLQQMADAAGEIQTLLQGFWEQVVTSTMAIPAGQPIEVGDKTLGFVEGTPQYVILRIEGRNHKTDYEFLAPGIAMALAEQGAKQDVPTFRMQQAAFYAVHTHLDPKYRERAIEFAQRAAQDGHDPQPIERFVNFDPTTVGIPETRAAQPPATEMEDKIPKQMAELGIFDFREMRPEQAAKAIDAILQSAVAEKDDLRKAMTFEVACMLAVKAGDIRAVVDVLDEYHVWFDYDYVDRVEQAVLDVAKQPLDQRRARLLLSAMIDAAPASGNQQYKRKLIKAGQKVAKQHDLADLLSRLESATQ